MWQNSLVATLAVVIGFVFWVFGSVNYLIPYRHVLLHRYGFRMAWFLGLLAVNVFAGVFLVTRRLGLKDTGRKLAHIEKQMESR
jgi:hypothetical protein